MKTNVRKTETTPGFTTYEGAPAVKESAEKELVRAVSCLLLFEDSFYESGGDLAQRIESLCEKVSIKFLCDLAIKARTDLKLRHAPLYLMVQALKKKGKPEERNMVGQTISDVIQRADELAEILAIYWRAGRKPVPRQLKAGIAKAFPKFNEYSLSKYDRDGAVKLKDALFISHAKPKDEEQDKLWKRLIDGTMKTPETWEVALSAGKDKKETFAKLIQENKLGYMALLRNLRTMSKVGVDRATVDKALLEKAENSKALPYRFVAAARFAPDYAGVLSEAMLRSVKDHPKMAGKTAIIVDVSGSMTSPLSSKSEMRRMDAAGALAILLREVADARVFAFARDVKEVPNYRGLPLIEAIEGAVPSDWTLAGKAVRYVLDKFKGVERIVIVTDEQSADPVPDVKGLKGYIINVGSYAPALPLKGGSWTRISGFSERIVDWMMEEENEDGRKG